MVLVTCWVTSQHCFLWPVLFLRAFSQEVELFCLGRAYGSCSLVTFLTMVCEPLLLEGQILHERWSPVYTQKKGLLKEQLQSLQLRSTQRSSFISCCRSKLSQCCAAWRITAVKRAAEWDKSLEWPRHETAKIRMKGWGSSWWLAVGVSVRSFCWFHVTVLQHCYPTLKFPLQL